MTGLDAVVCANPDGSVTTDPNTTGYADGGTQLTVHGVTLTVDARQLTYPAFVLNLVTGNLTTNTPHTVHVIPGRQTFISTSLVFNFIVTADQGVQYDEALSFLSGRGSSTLVVGNPGVAPSLVHAARYTTVSPDPAALPLLIVIAAVAAGLGSRRHNRLQR
jgi:hypothetical protein